MSLPDNTKTGTVRFYAWWERTIPVASVIKVLLERRCMTAFRSPVFDTTSPGGGRQTETAPMRVTGISPLRGSLRAVPMKMARQEYHYHPDEIIAKQLVLLFCGRMGTARRLTWPSFMRENRTGRSWRILQSRSAPVGASSGNVFQSPDMTGLARCFSRCESR